ncbi:MAG: hypothetical protein HXY50_16990 [Ignavibacteriaceae bacterium]|nr:hypothetical protein [Ignavibacteriaceae bacterium]
MIKKQLFPLVLLIVFILNSQFLSAQDSQDSIKNSLKKGSWSLQFRISPNFTLSTFDGSNLSAKKHLTSNSAIRFGIGLSGYTTDREGTTYLENRSNIFSEEQSDYESLLINLSCYYLYYPHPQQKINMYCGVGPLISFANFNDKINRQDLSQDTSSIEKFSEEKYQYYGVGVLGLIGIEWFLNQQISIHAEYGSSLLYGREEKEETLVSSVETYKEKYTKKSEENRITFRSNSIQFGVSVYF